MKKIFAAILSAVLAMAACLCAGCEKKPATPVTPPPATGDEKPPFYARIRLLRRRANNSVLAV